MKEHLEEISNFVSQNKISFSEGLLKLCNYEIDHKTEVAAKSMIKAAAFPFVKTIDDYDFEFQPCVSKPEILELATLRFMENAENIVFLGVAALVKLILRQLLALWLQVSDIALIL